MQCIISFHLSPLLLLGILLVKTILKMYYVEYIGLCYDTADYLNHYVGYHYRADVYYFQKEKIKISLIIVTSLLYRNEVRFLS